MWEITLFSKLKYKKYFEYIKESLENNLQEKSLFALAKNGNTVVISIASESKDEKTLDYIKNLIAEVIVLIEKEEFLKSKLVLENLSGVCKMALIKALVLFDIEDDIAVTKKHINLNTNIDLHAFFIFRLKELQKKWKHLVFLTSNDSFYENNVEILLEFLRFLIESLPFNKEVVTVSKQDKKFCVCYKTTSAKSKMLRDTIGNEIDLVTTLISLSPKKIYLKDINLSEETFNMIKYIFNQRVIDEVENKG